MAKRKMEVAAVEETTVGAAEATEGTEVDTAQAPATEQPIPANAGESPEEEKASEGVEEEAPTTDAVDATEGSKAAPDTEQSKVKPWKAGRILKVGKPIIKGEDVRALQTVLIEKGFNCGIGGANGIYGKETAHAVRMFQSMNRLIVDGRAGKFTVTKLGGEWEEPKKK